jgi:hypothetical protein
MSAALEAVQPIFGRTTDWSGDFVTNCMAVGVGSAVGLLGRFLWAYIRTEAVNAEIRKATVGFADGQVIFRQGEPSDKFYIIRSGQVVLTREANGVPKSPKQVPERWWVKWGSCRGCREVRRQLRRENVGFMA